MNPATIADPASAPVREVDDEFYEIIDGHRVELPPMSASATQIAFEVANQISYIAQANNLGTATMEMLFHLDLPVDRNRRPDAAFISYERWPKGRRIGRENAWDVVPDLAVEVISPSDLAEELLVKLDEYFRAGVRLVWVIYPALRMLFVYDSISSVRGLNHTEEVDGGTVLPGLRLQIASFFPEVENA